MQTMGFCLAWPLIVSVVSVYFAILVASGDERPLKSRTFSVDLSGDDPRHPPGCKDP